MRQFIFFLIALTFSFKSFGQELKGRVLNAFNEPLENAYVVNTTTNSHTHTLMKTELLQLKRQV